MPSETSPIVRFLRWSEKYTKTDMVYLAGAGLWSNLNFVIVSILGLFLSIAYANLLSKETFGLYQYLLSLSALIGAVTLGGMNSAVTQAVARGHEGVLRQSVRLQLMWMIVPFGVSVAGAIYYAIAGNAAVAMGLVAISVLTPLTSVFNTYSAFLNGKKDFKRAFYFNSVINVVYYISIFLAIAYLKEATILLFVNLASNAIVIAYLYFRTVAIYRPNDVSDPAALTYGKHLSVMNAFGTVITQLDSVLVFHFLGALDLAVYTFASSVPDRIAGLSKFVSVAALPKFSVQSGNEIRSGILSKMLRAGIASALLAGIYALLAPIIFNVFFPQYAIAIHYSQIYALVIVTTSLGGISTTALVSQRLQKQLYLYNLISPTVLFVLQVPLLLYFGIFGILSAKLLSNIFNIILSVGLLFSSSAKASGQR